MYFEDLKVGMAVEIPPAVIQKEKMLEFARNGLVEVTIHAYNQTGEMVLSDVTEAIVRCRENESQ